MLSTFFTKSGLPLPPDRLYTLASTTSPSITLDGAASLTSNGTNLAEQHTYLNLIFAQHIPEQLAVYITAWITQVGVKEDDRGFLLSPSFSLAVIPSSGTSCP